jgi:hypothetical protein
MSHCIPHVKGLEYFDMSHFVLHISIAAGSISGVGFGSILLRDASLMVSLGVLLVTLFACFTNFMT